MLLARRAFHLCCCPARPYVLGPTERCTKTKGREADGVVLVFRPNDYYVHWKEDREPYEKRSRLLFVAISRARQKVAVILPPQPHQLVAPFRNLAAVVASGRR